MAKNNKKVNNKAIKNLKLIVPNIYVDGNTLNIPGKAIRLKENIGLEVGIDNSKILQDFILVQAALIWGAQSFLSGKWNTSKFQKKLHFKNPNRIIYYLR
jgi:hypothetical protein